jgi:hypothetical protein
LTGPTVPYENTQAGLTGGCPGMTTQRRAWALPHSKDQVHMRLKGGSG